MILVLFTILSLLQYIIDRETSHLKEKEIHLSLKHIFFWKKKLFFYEHVYGDIFVFPNKKFR